MLKCEVEISKEELTMVIENALMSKGIELWGMIIRVKPEHKTVEEVRMNNIVLVEELDGEMCEDEDAIFVNEDEIVEILMEGKSVYVLEIEDYDTIVGYEELTLEKLLKGIGRFMKFSMINSPHSPGHWFDFGFHEGNPHMGCYVLQEAVFDEQRYG